MSEPLGDVLTFAERAYVRMQAEQLIRLCLDRGNATPFNALLENLVLAGAGSGGITLAGIFAVHEIQSGELLVMIFAIPGVLAGILQLFLNSNRHAKKEPAIPLKALLRFTRVTAGFALPASLLAANAPLWVAVGFAWVGFVIDRGEFYEGLAKAKPGW